MPLSEDELDLEDLANMAGLPPGYVHTAVHAIAKYIGSKTSSGGCEFWMGTDGAKACPRKAKFWVQRGPVNRMACHFHLIKTVEEFWAIKPGRYGVSEHYEGYWIRATASVVVKMKTEGGGWR